MFSHRTPADLTPNRLARELEDRRRSGRPVIDLTESNPTRAGFEYPPDLLQPLAQEAALRYAPAPLGDETARAAVSREYARQGLAIPAERIVLTASTSEAYSLIFKILADAGDEVLVPRPSYPLFDHLTRLDLVTPRHYDLEYHGRWSIDFDSIDRNLSPRTRAILVVSPNNPTGSFVTRDELERLESLCAGRGVAIIADEVFADYRLDADAGPIGRAGAVRRALCFSLGGLSKSAGLPQVKLGWIAAVGPEQLAAEALRRLELAADTYLSVSTPVQVAAAELLERGAAVRTQIAARVRANYAHLMSTARTVPSCAVLHADGGWYAVLRTPTFETEEALVLRLLERDGVLTHPGYFFDFPRETHLVVSLLTPADAFHEGISRVLRHFACTASAGPDA